MTAVISALLPLAEVRRVNFWPASIAEFVYGDGRVYQNDSLPGVMAGFPTTYHHDSIPFLQSMRDHTREKLLDPSRHLPGSSIEPLPQDNKQLPPRSSMVCSQSRRECFNRACDWIRSLCQRYQINSMRHISKERTFYVCDS